MKMKRQTNYQIYKAETSGHLSLAYEALFDTPEAAEEYLTSKSDWDEYLILPVSMGYPDWDAESNQRKGVFKEIGK